MKRRLTEKEKIYIIENRRIRILSQIARDLDRNRSTLFHFLKRVDNRNSIHNFKQKGRPKVISILQRNKILRYISKNPDTYLKEIKQKNNLSCCLRSISKLLRKSKVYYLNKRQKPIISRTNINKRLKFAKKLKHWSQRKLNKIIFLDECSVELIKYPKRRQWRRKGEDLKLNFVTSKVQVYVKQYLKFLSFISYNGQSNVIFINQENRWNQKTFCDILQNNIESELNILGYRTQDIFLAMDKDTVHNGAKVQKLLKDLGIKTIDWPGQSSDINPIENMYFLLKRNIYNEKNIYKKEELKEAIKYHWKSIPLNIVRSLTTSFNNRLTKVLNNYGKTTKY